MMNNIKYAKEHEFKVGDKVLIEVKREWTLIPELIGNNKEFNTIKYEGTINSIGKIVTFIVNEKETYAQNFDNVRKI